MKNAPHDVALISTGKKPTVCMISKWQWCWCNLAYVTCQYISFLCMCICDVIKQNESELANTVFKIQPNKADSLFCFLLFVQSFNCLYRWNPIDQSLWGFHQIKAHTIENAKKPKIIFWLQTHFAWSHHICSARLLDLYVSFAEVGIRGRPQHAPPSFCRKGHLWMGTQAAQLLFFLTRWFANQTSRLISR